MKIVTVVGARPQFIKAATVSRVVARTSGAEEILVHTGQHYDTNMSDLFFTEMAIPAPRYHLGIGSGDHGVQTGRMLAEIEKVLQDERPDTVLVYGDTNSTLAGALAAVKLHIPVAHVEAGLRSFNRRMPEEINRVLTDHAADLLFTPTDTATRNLAAEGIPAQRIQQVGDVMYDAALFYAAMAGERSRILADLQLTTRRFILATVHRAENTDDPERLLAVIHGLRQAAESMPVILPLHPRTRKMMMAAGLAQEPQSPLQIIDPVGYFDMITLERHAAVIATDSGGVQKEAFFYSTPCVTLREETEWIELIQAGWNRLCLPESADAIATAINAAIGTTGIAGALYGSGDAAEKVVAALL